MSDADMVKTITCNQLAGLTITTTTGTTVYFNVPPDDDPPAGVREPRRPLTPAPALAAEADL